jgi:hypothetical protein
MTAGLCPEMSLRQRYLVHFLAPEPGKAGCHGFAAFAMRGVIADVAGLVSLGIEDTQHTQPWRGASPTCHTMRWRAGVYQPLGEPQGIGCHLCHNLCACL